MDNAPAKQPLDILRAYADGMLGTRATIERLGIRDYADLLIALAQNNLKLPRPAETDSHRANVARAEAILQPRLRHAG